MKGSSAIRYTINVIFLIFIAMLFLFIRSYIVDAPNMWFLYFIPFILLVLWAVYTI
jgi:hypothetical protein